MSAYAGGTDDAEKAMREIVNGRYANAVYNSFNESGAAIYAAPSVDAAPAIEAIPSPVYGGGSFAPVEVHIHLEGNASPETVQALEDCVRRGELQEAVADAIETIQTDAARKAM